MPGEGYLRILILHRAQGGRCAGCGNMVRRYPGDPLAPTFDHFEARSAGGSGNIRNGILKHRRCNEARGNQRPNGCDRIWHGLVSLRLKRSKRWAKRTLKIETEAERRRAALQGRQAADEAGRIVDGPGGELYRIWGLMSPHVVRCGFTRHRQQG